MTRAQKNAQNDSSELLFAPRPKITVVDDNGPKKEEEQGWKIMVVDDDEVVHQVTLLVLADYKYDGKPVQIVQGYSGAECLRLLDEHPDTAVLLLDVVMETDSAGLDTVKQIREQLNNEMLRIILRTGQPGQAPEKEVINQYDINDYRDKTDLTAQKLYTCVTTALRAYSDLKKIENLVLSNTDLERRVKDRTREIMKINQSLQNEVEQRRRAYRNLARSETRLSEAQKIARIGNWDWDQRTDDMHCSEQVLRILNMPTNDSAISFDDMMDLVVEDDRVAVKLAIDTALNNHQSYNIDHRMITARGELIHVQQQGKVELDRDGKVIRLLGTMQDTSQRHEAEAQMRKLSGAVEQIADSVMITNINGVIEYTNPAFESMTGFNKEEIIGKTPRILKSDQQSEAFYKRLWNTILNGEVFSDVIINRKKDGQLYYEEKTITPQMDRHGKILHFISTGKDVTERIEAQERLYHLAHHDSLTGLPNRVLLQDRLSQAIARIQWHDRKIAVLFMDLDRFKIINDTLGHAIGDQLLQVAAVRLSECIREGDTVARLGGDEFAIVLNDIADVNDVTPISEKIMTAMTKPIVINGHELFVTASIGISLFPRDGTDSQSLLKKADVAMYRAKSQGKDNVQLYNSDDENQASQRLSMETRLRRALDKDEFSLNYQPQVSIARGNVIGFESLLRWHYDEVENISPMQFIPILEDTGMINPVGDWVLQTACMKMKEWQDLGMQTGCVAVNLSIRQFKCKGLVERIERILSETGLAAEYLELEITEGLLIDQINETAKVLNEFHEMGVHLSIDDFGTGYSSMNYLKRLPFDTLKIDRSFVRDVTFNQDDAAIASAIITLGHTMGMNVIAEGVETVEQLAFLRSQKCDSIQGYLYSPPLSAEAVLPLIKEQGGPKIVKLHH